MVFSADVGHEEESVEAARPRPEPGRVIHRVIVGLLRAALVVTLGWACWSLYRGLPPDDLSAAAPGSQMTGRETEVRIMLRRAPEERAAAIPVEIYSNEVIAAQRDPLALPRGDEAPGRPRPRGVPPIKAQLDERGEATVRLRPGRWWVFAMLPGPRELTWRLPINVAGRLQTVELTPENAYAREKQF